MKTDNTVLHLTVGEPVSASLSLWEVGRALARSRGGVVTNG